MKQVALVTCQSMPDLTASEQLLIKFLTLQDIQSHTVVWDDANVDWTQFDLVIIRTTWDYHNRPDDFSKWIKQLRDLGVPLHNSPDTLLWNMEKVYLRTLHENGIQIIPTQWANSTTPPDLKAVLTEQGWDRALLKPVFGAGSRGIHVVDHSDLESSQKAILEMLQLGEVMIQPIMKEVQNGELSIVFFNHEYSHTIRKTPQNGAVLLNSSEPNAIQLDHAPEHIIDIASNILNQTQALLNVDKFLYARVDGVPVGDEFLLMELELLEPHLFLDRAGEQSAQHFAQVIYDRLNPQ